MKWPWMAQYQRNWATCDIIKQYLQGRGYHACRRERVPEDAASDDAGVTAADPEDPDLSFNPFMALKTQDARKEAEEQMSNGDTYMEGEPTAMETTLHEGMQDSPAIPEVRKKTKTLGDIKKTKLITDMNEDTPIYTPTTLFHSDDIVEDNNACSVFVDEDGFFLDHKGNVIEVKYNAIHDIYMLTDNSTLLLDAWPESLDDYANCFGDGVPRLQNSSGHWRVRRRELSSSRDVPSVAMAIPLKDSCLAPSTPVKSSAPAFASHATIVFPDSPLNVLSEPDC